MLGKFLVIVAIIAALLLGIVLNTTTPASAGAIGVLGVFILTYMLVLCALTFLICGLSWLMAKIANSVAVRRPVVPLTLKRSYYYASVVALAPVIIVSLQSVGGVGVYELGLIILLVVIGCIYVTKRMT
jgi:hypothetical protein